MMIPALPAALWLLAAAFLILLLLVVFGYHLYQRSRLIALSSEAGAIGELAARKERLTEDIAEMQKWLAANKNEVLKLEAERRSQEVARADLAQLEKNLENRRKEADQALKYASELDMLVVKKRNLLSRLEAEVKTLEDRKSELEPLEKSLLSLRSDLEKGKIQLALLGEQELKTATLRQQAYALEREIDELQKNLAPLRQEKNRLRLFIEQARHASSVKNERILEQNEQIRNLEINNSELEKRAGEIQARLETLESESKAANERIERLITRRQQAQDELQAERSRLKAEVASLKAEEQVAQQSLNEILKDKARYTEEVAQLEARKAALELLNPERPKKSLTRVNRKHTALVRPAGIQKVASPKNRTEIVYCQPLGYGRS